MKALPAIALLLLISCGEDEQPAPPTFADLIAGQEIVWPRDGQLVFAKPSEMTSFTCTLESSGVEATCYSLDNGCGAGDQPTVCYNERAEFAGCIKGRLPIDLLAYYYIDQTLTNKPRVNFSGEAPSEELKPCLD